MRVIDYRMEHPILREALSRAPDMKLEWIQSDIQDDQIVVQFWAEGGDFEAFEAGIEDDPTVSSPLRSVEVSPGKRLYQLRVIDEGFSTSIYSLILEEGGITRELTATRDGWKQRIAFPDERSISRLFTFLEENDVQYEIFQIIEERDVWEEGGFQISNRQRQALAQASEMGYWNVPRACSLKDVGDALGISDQAASERIRRGIRSLLEDTIAQDSDSSRHDHESKE